MRYLQIIKIAPCPTLGESLQSTWRPTRQRIGHILWSGSAARYELSIEDGTTFIQGFIKYKKKIGPRGGEKYFPNSQNDFVIACAWRLIVENLSVLVYCPEKRSVNAVANALLLAHKEGFLLSPSSFDLSVIQKALEVGNEWLGKDHNVLKCLSLGVAIHHADLPRPFLREIDQLIRDKLVKIVIASPTLSKGLNISASCVLFQGMERFNYITKKREIISNEEFLNVAGRAGRAYVDLDGQVLGICYTTEHLTKWREVVRQDADRKLESGLLRLVLPIFLNFKKKIRGGEDIYEYVINNSNIWEEPSGNDLELNEWRVSLEILDTAILSLIGDAECGPDDVAEVLDNILSSSFLKRRLLRYKEVTQKIVPAILNARAKYICSITSANQRKGYFFSGVGLSTGQFLDVNAEELNNAVSEAENAMQQGDEDHCIEEILKIAERIFEVSTFRPNVIPKNWKKITKGWLTGVSMADLQSMSEDASTFIESALVYRLVWALEAIRNRSRANNEQIFSDDPSYVTAAIETGTVSLQQALLIQCGLGSRIAASKALADCPGDYDNFKGLRKWLFSEEVVEAAFNSNWPSPETRQAWVSFVDSQQAVEKIKWEIIEFDSPCSFVKADKGLNVGDPIFVWQSKADGPMRLFTPELAEIGRLDRSFKKWATPWATGQIKDTNTVQIRYIGPVLHK